MVPSARADWFDRRGIWALAALALAPLFSCWRDFAALFYFGDEWDQLDQIHRHGFWTWMWSAFGENFAPAFKLSWGTIAVAGGSYLSLVIVGFLVHVGCVGLFGGWLRLAGVGRAATAAAMLAFGLAASNLETLTWTIQLITLQGAAFFLAAARWHAAREYDGRWDARSLSIFGGLLTLGTFSTVRGPLFGLALAAATLWPMLARGAERRDWRMRAKLLLVCGAPAVLAIAVTLRFVFGHQPHAATGLGPSLIFAVWYFFLNPFQRLFDFTTVGPHTLVVLGGAKLALLVQGWRLATPAQRQLLLTLLAFELGNAALLGLGRAEGGVLGATTSRYQYFSLLTTLPFVAICLDGLMRTLPSVYRLREIVAAALLLWLSFSVASNWPSSMRIWGDTRGRQTRQTLFVDPNPPPNAVPGVDFISTAQAKELIRHFDLH